MTARVATASETVACERTTISAGTPATELMERAGRVAAKEIARRFHLMLPGGVAVFTGPGNNGGDGWVVARSLAELDFPVTVIEAAPAKTEEARAAEESAGIAAGSVASGTVAADAPNLGSAPVVIDALLGTGATGAPRGTIASAIEILNQARRDGAAIVALDLPSGLDATTGDHELCVQADLTLTFGVAKRGHLLAREVCGEIAVLDIGLSDEPPLNSLPELIDREWVAARIPVIPSNAHKGMRGRLAIVAGGKGMAGAAILSGRGALRSGIGLLRMAVTRENILAIHAGLPEAIVQEWPNDPAALASFAAIADAMALGPGLGNSPATRDLVERVLLAWKGPVVVDADALNVFAGDAESLATLLRGRPAVITPHPAELGRLLGRDTSDVIANRFEIGADFARNSGAAVLLKGSPTVIFSPMGERYVSAAGTAALATGGSGDVLTGIVGTLLAQMVTLPHQSDDALEATGAPDTPGGRRVAEAAAVAAFVHGRAAELCGPVRGAALEDILLALQEAWNEPDAPTAPGTIACIPAVP
jgi:NAD(P)H-hydrate epimerase